MGNINVKMVTTDDEFNAKVRFALSKKYAKRLDSNLRIIRKRVRSLLEETLASDPTVQELLNGQLKVDFGLTDELANSAVSQIIGAIGEAVSAEFFAGGATRGNAGSNKIVGTVRILINGLQASGIILGRVKGSYDSNGSNIDWLRWLMTQGSRVVVAGYEVVSTVEYDGRSRSGGGFMIKTGGDFRVDPEHAGVAGDNFITRAISRTAPGIKTIIKEEIKRGF